MRQLKTYITGYAVVILMVLGTLNILAQSKESETKIEKPKFDLHTAIYVKNINAIKQHIEYGSDLNKPEPMFGSTPLMSASAMGQLQVAQMLVEAGADVNLKNKDGSTALQIAIVFDKTEIAEFLIDAGSELNGKNNDGSTPLHTAAFFCRLDIVKQLLKNGADKTIKNNYGDTAKEVVETPFDQVEGIYDSIGSGLKSLGVVLDYDYIKATRPIIAEML